VFFGFFGWVFYCQPWDQAAVTTATQEDQALGLVAVLTACFSSGFAGVYYEKLVKESSQPSLVIRNLQLGLFSLFFALAGMLINDWEAIYHGGKRESSTFVGIFFSGRKIDDLAPMDPDPYLAWY
jgi:drug/metabolite transporter (DMT)-like permease